MVCSLRDGSYQKIENYWFNINKKINFLCLNSLEVHLTGPILMRQSCMIFIFKLSLLIVAEIYTEMFEKNSSSKLTKKKINF